MVEITDQILDEIVNKIVEQAAPEKIILFGSRATGEDAGESDIDLLVVEPGSFGPGRSRRKETARILKALMNFSAPIDLLIYSRDEIEKWRHSINHVVARALREGKVLYERP
jgi:predicted nucleotidyltransferase